MPYAIGAALGAVGALWFLAIGIWRARQRREGHAGRAWAALPVALLGPGAAFYGALAAGEEAAWGFLAAAVVTAVVFVLVIRSRSRPE